MVLPATIRINNRYLSLIAIVLFFILYLMPEREVELLKPLEDVTVYEKESASFDAEISEDDVPGEWKLKGELLRPSPVSISWDLQMH